ncbi:oxygenase MpaB family protein [uncultured Parasphingorhabdus sp.]|uniref:oxygenase MpaB family protein n=1 Tax=uncultured Parasphingorhabdus sp. TaxID=2709694 RepID=UPI0030DD8A18|tara:strand:+ start:46523 stop:47866 length:1344 start_codon:yes stop_codon:yes gene_type:complete
MTRAAHESLWNKVESQRERVPAMYGNIDFSLIPERFTTTPGDPTALSGEYDSARVALLADAERVDFIRAYTMTGDVAADAYASLMRDYSFRALVDMLTLACDQGVENVPDAPPELIELIREMEASPAWVDMELVEEGARLDRNSAANFGPFIIRGAFIATFMNKYAALPMAITGTLTTQTAARRVKDTATFFTTSLLPGALERYGPGFKSAAMVRLMHSMVRANVLRRPGEWDVSVYGIPIPQVDQMPAGLISIFLLSYKMIAEGREQFTDSERAMVELARYRCFLLGLPEDLLADTPQGIVDLMNARSGTLLSGYDDDTCGVLLRATMAADLRPNESLRARTHETFERAFAKLFFVKSFMGNDKEKAASIGVKLTSGDICLAAIAGLFIYARMRLYALAAHIPGLRGIADRRLVAKLKAQLADYGHAEFTTDARQYRPTTTPAAAD